MLGLGDMNADQLASKLEETLPVIRSVSEQFKDPVSQTITDPFRNLDLHNNALPNIFALGKHCGVYAVYIHLHYVHLIDNHSTSLCGVI